MLQMLAPWFKTALAIGLTAVPLSFRPVELFLLAVGVFLLAYLGVPEFRHFTLANSGACITAVVTGLLVVAGLRLGPLGVTLSIMALATGSYIVVHDLGVIRH